jgi:serine/threonine protein kinase
LTEANSKFIIAGILLGVKQIHEKGIIHRDIKANNVMFDSHGYPKIIDFSIALVHKAEDANLMSSKKRWKSKNGTPSSMAPEILVKSKYNHVSDYYSIGALLYHMMTGSLLPIGCNNEETIELIYSR